ncbi:MAG: type IV pilin N-terminal domain-containing protein [Thermoplasmata archaeon]
MNFSGRRRHRGRRAVAPIIGTILILLMTIVVFSILFSFRFYTPPSPPSVNFLIHSGGSNPVWGDPTDEKAGTYSLMNTSQIIVSAASPTNIPLSSIQFTFQCNNESTGGNITTLLQGTLESMTWFPGATGNPPAGAPTLGWCASFHAGGFGGGAFGTLYNRLGMFVPISETVTVLASGDTFFLYIHNGCYPIDSGHCDKDDYHGAPPWCFTSPGACTIFLTYLGSPDTLLAQIPVNSLAPPQS